MKLKIDISGVSFICTRGAEPRVDMASGAVRMDKETGQPLYQVQVAALDSTGGEVLGVTTVGQPSVNVGSPVTVEGLVAIPWTQGDRSGVAYRATSVKQASPSNPPTSSKPNTPTN